MCWKLAQQGDSLTSPSYLMLLAHHVDSVRLLLANSSKHTASNCCMHTASCETEILELHLVGTGQVTFAWDGQ